MSDAEELKAAAARMRRLAVTRELRVSADDLNVTLSYERQGIGAATLILHRKVAAPLVVKMDEMLENIAVTGAGFPDRVDLLHEVLVMVRQVMGGAPLQVIALDGEEESVLDSLFGELS
jgi:hypothetical protein